MKLPALLLCLSLPLCAGGLDDLKTALGHLQGKTPIRGTYTVQSWNRSGMGKEASEIIGSVSAKIEDDLGGLVVRWDRATLARAGEESKAKTEKGKAKDSPSIAMAAASAQKMAAAVDYAQRLLHLLEGGQLKQERPDVYQGKTARLLELQVASRMSEEERKGLKEYSNVARIWIGPDGAPLGASLSLATKARMLMISVEMEQQEELCFAVASGRLLLAKQEERLHTKSLGVEIQQRTVSTFTAH